MNSDQFDQLQMRLFTIEQEENRKRLLARNAITGKLRDLLDKLGAATEQKMSKPAPEPRFEEHSLCTDHGTVSEILAQEGLDDFNLNITMICDDHWKSVSEGFWGFGDQVISKRGPITEQFEIRLSEVISIVNELSDSDTTHLTHLTYLLSELFKTVGGVDGHTIIFDNSVAKITWHDSLIGKYKVSTPEFEIELEEIVGTNETLDSDPDIIVIRAVKVTTANSVKVHFFEDGNEVLLDHVIMQGSLQGFTFDPEVIALWK